MDIGSVTGATVKAKTQSSAASLTDLRSLASGSLTEGQTKVVGPDGGEFIWNAASVLTEDSVLVVTPKDAPAAGRWLRRPGWIEIAVAFDYTQADASVIYTMPTGSRLYLAGAFWSCSVTFAGGSSSKIGLKGGAATGISTAGDILGGASGDATIASNGTYAQGTVGVKIGKPVSVLNAADTVVFNQMTSTFTSGVGVIHLVGVLLSNAGA